MRVESRGDVALAHMTHGKANALDLEFCAEIVAALDELATGSARAVVLTGNGSIFSAGVDLIRLLDGGANYQDRFVPALSGLMHALFRFPKPLIAAINGHAIAGGCIIACTADHRIMARGGARIGVPELQVRLPFPTAALEIVRFVVPPQHVHAVVYGGATYTPDAALRIGLVDELADAAALLDEALAVAARLAAVPSAVFTLTKRQLRAPTLATIQAGAARDAEVVAIWKDQATLERVREYVARTFRRADR